MMTVDINDLMRYGERINIEYKEASSDLPKSLWETYSSFANTIGGTIVLGIKEHRNKPIEERFEVKGVGDANKLLKAFWDTINSDKVSRNILVDNDVECVNYDGKILLIIHIPMANYTMRPIYINKNLLGGSFKRNYEGDYHCTDEEVKAMLRDANESGNDGVMVENYNMDDIDMTALHAYRNRFEVRNVDHIFNQLEDKEFLRNMGGYAINIGSGYPTILKTWKEENWRKPTLLDRTELRQVDLTLPMVSLLPEEVVHEMKAYYGSDYYSRLTAEEQQIVAYVWNGDCVSNVELQQMLGLNSIEVGKLLHQMVEKQMLNQENKKRWTTYSIRRENSIYYLSDKKNEERIRVELTVIEKQVLALITEDANITYETLGQKLTLGKTTLYKAVHHLKDLNIIVREGGRKDGYWKIIKTL